MPTGTDLREAFTVLERQADRYDLHLDVAHPVRARRPKRHVPAMVVAAATVAALAVGGAFWARHEGRTPAGGSVGRAALPVRSLPFALAGGSGWRVGDTMAAPDEARATLLGRGSALQLEVYAAGTKHLQAQRGVAAVRIGAAAGWYADGSGPGIVTTWEPQWDKPSSPDPGRAVDATRQVVWRYAPGAWAALRSSRGAPTRAALLAAARSLDFGKRTPLRVPFKLAKAPADQPLMLCSLVTVDGHWQVRASWGTDWPAVELDVFKSRKTTGELGGTQFTVAGRAASWWGGLSVDLGHGLQLEVSGPADDEHPGRLTRDDAVKIAESITYAPNLEDRRTWFRASVALP